MDKIRKLIQESLTQIPNLDCGVIIEENVVEEGKTYFGYQLSINNISSDFNKNYTMQVTLTGYLVRKIRKGENTLEIVDNTLELIKEKLKSLNIRYSYNDISSYTDGFIKIQVRGSTSYNEINNELL